MVSLHGGVTAVQDHRQFFFGGGGGGGGRVTIVHILHVLSWHHQDRVGGWCKHQRNWLTAIYVHG